MIVQVLLFTLISVTTILLGALWQRFVHKAQVWKALFSTFLPGLSLKKMCRV